jgi:hypothetical protein
MEPYTLDRKFLKQDVIDDFNSVIWTERYYGDSEVELVVPATPELIAKLPEGVFLSIDGTDEIMILETANVEDGLLKLSGVSLLLWLNNRFVRTSVTSADKLWYLTGMPPGQVLWHVVSNMCVAGSPYLNGTINTGITNPQALVVPGLGLRDYDKAGDPISVGIEFKPVYDAIRDTATTYQVGMQITLDSATDTSYFLGFRSYRGLDHTSSQTDRPVVRFSPQMDSLTNIKELRSIAALKTLAYVFAPDSVGSAPGIANLTGQQATGFDLRALMILDQEIPSGTPAPQVIDILNSRAKDALSANRYVKAVDGEIVPTNQFQYGVHYNLGDLIEVQGNTDVVRTSRVTEYIRAQDEAGERAYPTVAMLD